MTRTKPTAVQQPASDDALSDHEWRLKMAAEGKALYQPGKTTEELQAEMAASRGSNVIVNLVISEEERTRLEVAASEVEYTFIHAANVFSMLHTGLTCGNLDGDSGEVHSVLELCMRGMRHAEEHEGRVMSKFSARLRELSAQRLEGDFK